MTEKFFPTVPAPHSMASARSKKGLWFAAVKPPMYTVAITPILVGSFAAYADIHSLSTSTLLTFLAAAIAIIAWLNLTNDVFDFDTGVDRNKQESVVNLCGATRRARNAIFMLAFSLLGVAFALLYSLAHVGGSLDGTVLVVMGIAIMGGYMYQGPPFRLGYYGVGEPICFVTWAISVAAAYYSQLSAFRPSHLAMHADYPSLMERVSYLLLNAFWSKQLNLCSAAILVATPTATILFCSHFHQVDDDIRAGKRSPVARIGTKNASMVLQFVLMLFLLVTVCLYGVGMLPSPPFFCSLLAMPYALQLAMFVRKKHFVPEAVRPAKYYAVKFHFLHGFLVAFGFFIVGRTSTAVRF